MTIQPPSGVVESQVREAGLLERPRGGHRGERVSFVGPEEGEDISYESKRLKVRTAGTRGQTGLAGPRAARNLRND